MRPEHSHAHLQTQLPWHAISRVAFATKKIFLFLTKSYNIEIV